jgi:aspartyl-tRNA synthetase
MSRYGSDKPDLRFGIELKDITKECESTEFKVFQNVMKNGGRILCINVENCGKYSRSQIDEINDIAVTLGAKGLSFIKIGQNGIESPIKKFFTEDAISGIVKKAQGTDGDLLLIVADKEALAQEVIGELRLHIARTENLINKNDIKFAWITDFPLFKWNEEEKRLESEHHPFTMPKGADIDKLKKDPLSAKASSYDLVINGTEIASGSIRIHRNDLQQIIFDKLGINRKEAEKKFGFLLKAFNYGAPPHGGIAFGLDRFVTLFSKSESIRDVIAFPKTQKAICTMTDAPSTVPDRQLKELGIDLIKEVD